ncbi:DUF2752 domain-containing protein [Streptomyces boncukensis]|uniref:DUF2752 domain-containing protein n=1 Tax=Streptomyces boncukensis TaxID=2711219 RepID=A0A6G4X0W0_9ACTN|nr:DUF2752 domain-containing protein [Streptomyces boncukensis]
MPRLAAPVGVLAGVGAAFAYVAAVDPREPGHFPACPVRSVAGVLCPGCGGLRSAYAVAHGDLGAALGANALAVAAFVLFAVGWTYWAVRTARGRPYTLPVRPRAWHGWTGLALVLGFTIVRNTPLGSALAP